MENSDEDNLISRTEEVRDILERIPQRPTAIITLIVIGLAGFLLFFGWLIEYPEKVTGPISITARQAPVKLVANVSGKLHILKNDSDTIKENEIFAFIDNPGNLTDIQIIENFLIINNPDTLYRNPIEIEHSSALDLGELSTQYYTFLDALEKVSQYKKGKPYEKKSNRLLELLKSQIQLKQNDQKQFKTKLNVLKIAKKSVNRDSSLYHSTAIPEVDLEHSSTDYYNILGSSQSVEKDIESITMQIQETRYQLQSLLLEQSETESKLKIDLISSYNELITGIRRWKLNYCFCSPINGKLEFLNFWRENDFISAGTNVFSVIPSDNPILGQVFLPSIGVGKVEVNQDVIIKLDNYPYIEYGSIKGKVKTISHLSNQITESNSPNIINTYLISIDLPLDLTTNYGKKLDFGFEIKGSADILTRKRKLLERLFDNLKYIVSNK